jgi:hypothetical protein
MALSNHVHQANGRDEKAIESRPGFAALHGSGYGTKGMVGQNVRLSDGHQCGTA